VTVFGVRSIGLCPVAIATAVMLFVPREAVARKLQMSGSWAIRNGQVFIPLQFAPTLGGSRMTMTSMGDLSMAFGFPNGPVVGAGAVAASSGTTSLKVPQGVFHSFPSAVVPVRTGSGLLQITTMFVVDAPYQAATLYKNGGPGFFTWCPSNPACTAGQPLAGLGARVIYHEGSNRFGGTMQIALRDGGVVSSFYRHTPPSLVAHIYFGAPNTFAAHAVGAGAADLPSVAKIYLTAGVVTQPLGPPTPYGLVTQPGGKVTTGAGLTTTGATGPLIRLAIGTTPGGMSFGQLTTQYGFPHTTGTVIVQQTAGTAGDDFFTVMGSDMRTALGAGNLSTVAGGISFRNSVSGQTPYATFHRVWFSLAPPVPSLSPAGAAAAGALLLLAVGYAERRKLPEALELHRVQQDGTQ